MSDHFQLTLRDMRQKVLVVHGHSPDEVLAKMERLVEELFQTRPSERILTGRDNRRGR